MKHLPILLSLLIAGLVAGCSADPAAPPSAADVADAAGRAAGKARADYCAIPLAERQALHAALQASVRELRAVPYLDPCPAIAEPPPAPLPVPPQSKLTLPGQVADRSGCTAAREWPRLWTA